MTGYAATPDSGEVRTGRWLRRIVQLDPVTEHEEIYRISAGLEFPWDYTRSLEFALFRTYCVPTISALLSATGEFHARPQQRYDDTALLMAELAAHGYDSRRGKEALRVINRAHQRFAIANDDLRYVLSTFIFDPIDWIDRYGWRRLSAGASAGFHSTAVGLRMGIRTSGDVRRVPCPQGGVRGGYVPIRRHQPGDRYVHNGPDVRVVPGTAAAVVRLGAWGLLDPRMLAAFGFRAAPPVSVPWWGALRSAVVRLLPPRRTNRLTPALQTYCGYPDGYQPADLGAPPLRPQSTRASSGRRQDRTGTRWYRWAMTAPPRAARPSGSGEAWPELMTFASTLTQLGLVAFGVALVSAAFLPRTSCLAGYGFAVLVTGLAAALWHVRPPTSRDWPPRTR